MIVKEGILRDDEISLESLEVGLDNTTLLILQGYGGFAMCGALDVNIYNSEKMLERRVVCFKAVGVKTLEELYEAKIVDVSKYGRIVGITEGMTVRDGFKVLSKE